MFNSNVVDESASAYEPRSQPAPEIHAWSPSAQAPRWVERTAKRTIDIAGALAFLLLFGLLYVAVAWCIWRKDGGPVHSRQTRLGKDGKPFHLYRFRSRVLHAERLLEEVLAVDPTARLHRDILQKPDKDPRIPTVGRFPQKFSLDDLPQLWNVLRGDMSLVGPRPCMERQRNLYSGAWSYYTTMRPGLTGLWQVSHRGECTFSQRVALDVDYVSHWSLWADCRILAKAVRAVIVDGE